MTLGLDLGDEGPEGHADAVPDTKGGGEGQDKASAGMSDVCGELAAAVSVRYDPAQGRNQAGEQGMMLEAKARAIRLWCSVAKISCR